MRVRGAFVVLLVAAAAAPAVARDSKTEKAAEHFALAEQAERRKDWEAAILEYKQAYALKPHPDVLYNIAKNYERLEDWGNAAEYYQRYLDESPDAADRQKTEARIAALRKKASDGRGRPGPGSGR